MNTGELGNKTLTEKDLTGAFVQQWTTKVKKWKTDK